MNLMRYNLKRNHVLMYVTKHIMHFKIERPTIHNCSSCIGNINVMWQLWDAMQVYVKLYQTKHFKCFFRNKDTHVSVTMTNIHAHQTYVFLGFFLKTHGKLLYLRLTTFTVLHMMLIMFTWHECIAAMYIVGLSFWKSLEKLRFPTFELVYVHCIMIMLTWLSHIPLIMETWLTHSLQLYIAKHE